MADFNIRSESIDVEQIMKQIRTRITEKRGVDYTEEQIRELASVRLEKFLDPKNLRSDLLEQFRKSRPALPEPPGEPPPVEAPFAFDDQTLFQSHRGPLRFIRNLLKPLLKLFFNYNTLNQVLHSQAQFNVDLLKRDVRRRVELQQQVYSFERSRGEWNVLYYEVLHNLVLETTRNAIELKNMKMRLEALASRLDFSERRVRALEGVVQYRPEAVRPRGGSHSGRSEQSEGRDRDRGDRDRGDREPSREQNRDASREPRDGARDRNRDRQPRAEPEIATQEASDPAPEAAPLESPVDAGATPGSVSVPGTPGSAEPGARRRRRRRRGRRGTGLPGGAAPGGGDQGIGGDAAGDPGVGGDAAGGDEGFDDGDEGADGDVEAGDASDNDAPIPGTPHDPDQQ